MFGFDKKEKELFNSLSCLTIDDIHIGLSAKDKIEAITMAGEFLVKRGSVTESYIDAMMKREDAISTYIGEGVAIPHGIGDSKKDILSTGLVVLQFPQGVPFDDNMAYVVIGIAALNHDHLPILQAVASVMMEEDLLQTLKTTSSREEIYTILTSEVEV